MRSAAPAVSVITPCAPGRYLTLFERAIPSLQRQTFTNWEHILVAAPDVVLQRRLLESGHPHRFFANPPSAWPDQGAWNFLRGTHEAQADVVAYLCDDDEWLAEHLELHMAALAADAGAAFSLSRVQFVLRGALQFVVGDMTLQLGHLDTNGIVHRRSALAAGAWRDTGKWDADWDMVSRWASAGLRGTLVNQVTCLHHDGWLAR